MERSLIGVGEGCTISHYRVGSRIGAGGMGLVYKCLDLRLNRPVALKFLPPELTLDENAKRRFVREAQAASALDHPNICTIHDIDEMPDGQLFICMAYYEGETLDKRLGKGPLPVREAVQIVARVAEGLARAHDHEIIHRDVKPDNIMLTRDGEVKILDFGLAKLKGSSRITRKGATVGTCAYMSPEQTLGDDVDARSDVFSLGVVLYQLLTDQAPFKADFPEAVMFQIVHNDPRPLTDLRPEISAALRRVVERAMRKNPAERYQSMSEMRDDLLALTGVTVPFWKKIPRPYRRLAVTLAAIAAAAGLTAVIPQTRNGITRLFPGMPERIHVAVLPFENVGQDPQNQAFCDGLTETLCAQLSQLERFRDALWVVPATEVRAARVSSPVEARRRLGVNLVVTGAVQRLGDRFRVTLNLIDPIAEGVPRQLDAAMIDNVMERVATLQDETVMRMAGMMDLELRPQEEDAFTAGGTSVSAAYDFYLQGIGYVRSFEITGNIDRAVDAFSMAIDRDSLYALAYAGLGEAYYRKYRETTDARWMEAATRNAVRAVELDTMLAVPRITLGTILGGSGQTGGAIGEFERALALEPKSVLAYRGLASTYAAADRPAEAEETFQKAIAMKPDYWGTYNDFGHFHYNRGEYGKALAQYRKVNELAPDNPFGYNNAGGCFWALDQMENARSMFLRSLDAEPNHRAYTNLAALYYMGGGYAQSAAMCEQALKLNDSAYKTWSNLGNAYHWMPGKRDQAMQAYRRAAELAEKQRALTPRDPSLLSGLAGYYAVLGEKERAQALIDESLAIAPKNPRVLYFAGHACEQLGKRDEAFTWIGKALDNGYSVSDAERDPFLHELRKDERFAEIVSRARSDE